MPEITRFYGIIIKIFLTREHNPPHFHAIYGEYNGTFEITTLKMIEAKPRTIPKITPIQPKTSTGNKIALISILNPPYQSMPEKPKKAIDIRPAVMSVMGKP